MDWPDLTSALSGTPWAVVGAVATRRYMPERLTRDLDVLIAVADAAVVREQMSAAGYLHLGNLSIGGSTWRSTGGIEVDMLECQAPWCLVALAEARDNLDAQGLPVLPLPFLVLMKLQSGRAQDVADLARMLGQAAPDLLDRVRGIVLHFAPNDGDDLESLIALGQLEMGNGSRPNELK